MLSKLKLYYFFTTIICVTLIIISGIYIKETMENYNLVQNSTEYENCTWYFIWKFTILFNVFLFSTGTGFLGYLIYKRMMNYNKIIYIRIGPMIDTIILILLLIGCIFFGPLLILEIIVMVLKYKEIIESCQFKVNDPLKNFYVPFILIAGIMSVIMTFTLGIICSRRCSRRRIMSRRNIVNLGELINIV
jgi:hypothetical protein